ncbi:hypothetical protein EDB83DRAFT_248774 [Lactarius deliciosus]|nr:hypothetical protein EDB83DRAFT_248774 [Lactarius deliciosus]
MLCQHADLGNGNKVTIRLRLYLLVDFPFQISDFQASCLSSSLAFPSALHSRAALATRIRRVPDPGGDLCEVSHCAEACATIFDHMRPTDPGSIPTSPHSHAAVALRHRCVCDRRGSIYDSSRSAEACATPCDASPPKPYAPLRPSPPRAPAASTLPSRASPMIHNPCNFVDILHPETTPVLQVLGQRYFTDYVHLPFSVCKQVSIIVRSYGMGRE